MGTPDKGDPAGSFGYKAKCIAVVPHMVKGGFIFGAQNGKGVATCRTSSGSWSAPSFFCRQRRKLGRARSVLKGSDLVMTIMNDAGMKALLNNKVQLGGDASAAGRPGGTPRFLPTPISRADTGILTYFPREGPVRRRHAERSFHPSGMNDSTKACVRFDRGKRLYQRILSRVKFQLPQPARSFFRPSSRGASSGSLAERQEEKEGSPEKTLTNAIKTRIAPRACRKSDKARRLQPARNPRSSFIVVNKRRAQAARLFFFVPFLVWVAGLSRMEAPC